MKTETKRKIWAVILSLGLIIFFATGCKPKQVIQEKIIYKTDSLAITKLRDSLYRQEKKIAILEIDLLRTKEENSKLTNEVSRYETYYDTSKPIVPETGKPPVQSEITTIAKSELERTIQEKETLIQEFRREVETLTTKNSNLELEVESLRQENSDLKSKAIPAFNLKSFLWGMLTGAVLLLVLIFFVRK